VHVKNLINNSNNNIIQPQVLLNLQKQQNSLKVKINIQFIKWLEMT